jgi:hypothetical protein
MSLANRRLYMGLALLLSAAIVPLVLISANGLSDGNYFEYRLSVTFDGRLDIPIPSESVAKIETASSQEMAIICATKLL